MTNHRGTGGALGPVAAGAILSRSKGGAVGLRAGQDVVPVRRVAAAVDHLALFAERRVLAEIIRRTMKVGDVFRDHRALGVLPRTASDAVLRIHRIRTLCGEVRLPSFAARTGSLRQSLALTVGAFEPAQIAAFAGAVAGDEEGHRVLLCLHRSAHSERSNRCACKQGQSCRPHWQSSCFVAGYRYQPPRGPEYSSSVTYSIQSTCLPSSASCIAM